METTPETSELRAFVQTADAGSVSAAARELSLPRATVSRRLERLEERLGTKLMQRTTRQLRLTHAGEELYGRARAILAAVDEATAVVRRDDGRPQGLLRVSVPPVTGNTFRALLLLFAERYPEVTLEVIASTRHEDLVKDNIDVAWRAGQDLDPGLVARQLLRTDALALASPAYLARAGTPTGVDELLDHDCLLGFSRGERPATHWPLVQGGTVRVKGRLVTNDVWLILDAACRDMGIAMLSRAVAGPALDSGLVVPVLPGVVGTMSQVALVYVDRRLMRPAVRAFVDFIAERFSDPAAWEKEGIGR